MLHPDYQFSWPDYQQVHSNMSFKASRKTALSTQKFSSQGQHPLIYSLYFPQHTFKLMRQKSCHRHQNHAFVAASKVGV